MGTRGATRERPGPIRGRASCSAPGDAARPSRGSSCRHGIRGRGHSSGAATGGAISSGPRSWQFRRAPPRWCHSACACTLASKRAVGTGLICLHVGSIGGKSRDVVATLSCGCFGACGGLPAWRSSRTGLCCPACQGTGSIKVPPTAAEEYAAVARSRGIAAQQRRAKARLAGTAKGKAQAWASAGTGKAPGRKRKRPRMSAADESRLRHQREREEKEWRRVHGPTPDQLDALRKENLLWTRPKH